jgi:hypothetical protein
MIFLLYLIYKDDYSYKKIGTMNLNERFNILAQAVELAQKNGSLSLDQAVEAKKSIEEIQKGENLNENFAGLVKICEESQKKGVFTLHDAYVVYIATEGIDAEIENFLKSNQEQAAAQEPAPAQPIGADINAKPAEPAPVENKKNSKKRGK